MEISSTSVVTTVVVDEVIYFCLTGIRISVMYLLESFSIESSISAISRE